MAFLGNGSKLYISDSGANDFEEVGDITSLSVTSQRAVVERKSLSHTSKRRLVGKKDYAVSGGVETNWGDTGFAAMETAYEDAVIRDFKITFSDSETTIATWSGFVSKFDTSGVAEDAQVETSFEIAVDAAITFA